MELVEALCNFPILIHKKSFISSLLYSRSLLCDDRSYKIKTQRMKLRFVVAARRNVKRLERLGILL